MNNLRILLENLMKHIIIFTLLLTFSGCGGGGGIAGEDSSTLATTPRSLILFSWDGVERVVFDELLESGQLPFVESLPYIVDMTCNTELKTGTSTRPQHAIMLTGYLSDETGIRNNIPWFNNPPSQNDGITLPEGLSIFERAREWFGKNIRIAGGVGKTKNVGDLLGFPAGEYWLDSYMPLPPRDERIYENLNGFDLFDNVGGSLQPYEPDMHPRYLLGQRFLDIAENAPLFLYFFHFSDPDKAGHHGDPQNPDGWKVKYGVTSQQYRDAIIACDKLAGEIYEKLAPSDPIVIVTSDHGFGYDKDGNLSDIFHHHDSPNTFLASNFPIIRDANMFDIAPTVYDILGIPYKDFYPKILGESLRYDNVFQEDNP